MVHSLCFVSGVAVGAATCDLPADLASGFLVHRTAWSLSFSWSCSFLARHSNERVCGSLSRVGFIASRPLLRAMLRRRTHCCTLASAWTPADFRALSHSRRSACLSLKSSAASVFKTSVYGWQTTARLRHQIALCRFCNAPEGDSQRHCTRRGQDGQFGLRMQPDGADASVWLLVPLGGSNPSTTKVAIGIDCCPIASDTRRGDNRARMR